ncbi:MAG: PaaI family thioesterase [Pyrinomonadaceae bacterium]
MAEISRKIVSGEHEHPPVAHLVGFSLTSIQAGQAIVSFEAKEQHTNPMGTLQGGVICVIADAAMATAFASLLEDHQSMITIELKINFLKSVRSARLQAVAKVIQKGKTIGLIECEVRDQEDNLIAQATSTCMTLTSDRAGGE